MASTKQVKRYVYPVQLDEDELDALEVIVGKLGCSKSEAIRDAIRDYAEHVRGIEVVKFRDISKAQARKEILEFLDKKDRAWSSDISDALRIDLTLVNSILEELWREKRVEPAAT
jgi:D-mannonate dehydratase